MVVVVAAAIILVPSEEETVLDLHADGVAVESSGDAATVAAQSTEAFVAGTSVLKSADRADPAVQKRIEADRTWLQSGSIPGADTEYENMAERALLDMRALTAESGAIMAAPVTSWKHVWPRDASFAVAAYSVTGHHDEAAAVLGFLADVAPVDGRWEARYRTDGTGPPDDRPKQLDGSGWVLWALWAFLQSEPDDEAADDVVEALGPAAAASADAMADSLGDDGLPEASPDYWEKEESEVTLGTAAPVSLGLRAAVAMAAELGVDPARWQDAAERLDAAIEENFGANGYPRTLPDGGADTAVTFLAPPFAATSEKVRDAVRDSEQVLQVSNGGHVPGEAWTKDVEVAWTPETALFALAYAGNGDHDDAERLLTFLDTHRTSLGSLPEKVDSRSEPASVAPLAWTSSLVLLTLAELSGDLPVVPSAE